jgi:hypothetical protein
MANMEGLRNVWGGEFNDELLWAFRGICGVFEAEEFVLAELGLLFKYGRNYEFGKLVDLEEELYEGCRAYRRLMNKRGFGELEIILLVNVAVVVNSCVTFSTHSTANSAGFLLLTRKAGTASIRSPLSKVFVHWSAG